MGTTRLVGKDWLEAMRGMWYDYRDLDSQRQSFDQILATSLTDHLVLDQSVTALITTVYFSSICCGLLFVGIFDNLLINL